jgi:hypothetical protein
MRAPNVTDSQHLRCKGEEKLLCQAQKRDTIARVIARLDRAIH